MADDRPTHAGLVEQALREFQGPLLRYAARIAGGAHAGADAVQEASAGGMA